MHALEVSIKTEDASTTAKRYENNIKKGVLSASAITVNSQDATRYDGTLPSSGFTGTAVTFKIRDKIVTLQTDAAIYRDDFEKILSTVTFSL